MSPRSLRPARGEKSPVGRRLTGDPWVATTHGRGRLEVPFLLLLSSFPLLLLLLPFSISPQSTVDGRFFPQSTADGCLLTVPPVSDRPAYRSAAGPVHSGRYGALQLGKENLDVDTPVQTAASGLQVQTRSQTAGAAHEERSSEHDEREVGYSPRTEEA
ncbi:hypothetical protein BHM03_00039663 [Ensete ventricosum]|nr:hypothetical protein BHM03_00039663 [Ensete ventricosum]